MLQEYRFDTGEVELNYAKGPDSGPPLVMLHAATARWGSFLAIMATLSYWNTLYALDLRGHGKSDRAASGYRCIDYARDTAAFLEEVVGEPAVLLGHSMGTTVAAIVASRHPDLVRAAILEEPILYPLPGVVTMFTRLRDLAGSGKSLAEMRAAWEVKNANNRRRAMDISQVDPRVPEAYLDGSAYEGFEPDEILRNISCPVLLLYGENGMLSKEQVTQIQATIPDCVMDMVAGADHSPHKAQNAAMAAIVADFLGSL